MYQNLRWLKYYCDWQYKRCQEEPKPTGGKIHRTVGGCQGKEVFYAIYEFTYSSYVPLSDSIASTTRFDQDFVHDSREHKFSHDVNNKELHSKTDADIGCTWYGCNSYLIT